MNVTFEIDELVLRGFPAADRYAIAAIAGALEQELARLIAERGLPAGWTHDVTLDAISGESPARVAYARTDALSVGAQIAAAIHQAISGKANV